MIAHNVPFEAAVRTWLRVGLISFGGPAGQIAVMHRILVDEKRWIGEERFLHALNYCMLLPGPEAQQLATYIGWLLHGTRGGLVAGTLFVLPGFIAMMALSFIYVLSGTHPLVAGVFLGLKAAVIALVVQALLRIARRALKTVAARVLALLAFAALVARVPFPLVIVAAGLFGYVWTRTGRADFRASGAIGTALNGTPDTAPGADVRPSAARALKLLAIWLPLWFAPVAAIALASGPHSVFAQLGVFFSKMAVVTFGGAYAVLAYVAQQAVERYSWVTPVQMLDGLGLAETTPGPLILVVQFVGFLAAYQTAGGAHPLLAGVAGAALTVWVTFVPSFLWIFLGAPYIERLRTNTALSGGLSAITAAVVGVIANLALWLTLHALFTTLAPIEFFAGLRIDLPVLDSLRLVPALLTALALALIFPLRQGLARTLGICAAAGIASTALGFASY